MTDITYIRTLEGFAYLAVVIDLYSRRVVGWSMRSRQTTDVVLQALLMAVWRRKPKHKVLVQGIMMNQKKLRRLYREEKLQVRRRGGRKRALGTRRPMILPERINERSLSDMQDMSCRATGAWTSSVLR